MKIIRTILIAFLVGLSLMGLAADPSQTFPDNCYFQTNVFLKDDLLTPLLFRLSYKPALKLLSTNNANPIALSVGPVYSNASSFIIIGTGTYADVTTGWNVGISSNYPNTVGLSVSNVLGGPTDLYISTNAVATRIAIGHAAPDSALDIGGGLTLREQAEPSDPDDGSCVIWFSNGTGGGNDGELIFKRTVAGQVTTNTITFVEF